MEPKVPNKKLEPSVYSGNPGTTEAKNGDFSPRFIRTMKIDVAEAIKKQNETSVSIAIAQEKQVAKSRADDLASRRMQGEDATPAPKKIGRVVIVLAILLIVFLSLLVYMFILPKISAIRIPGIQLPSFEKSTSTNTLPITKATETLAPSIIPAQSEKRFNIGEGTLAQIVAINIEKRAKGISAGSIKNLYFTDNKDGVAVPLTTNRLFAFVGIQIPDILARSLEKQFMTGFFGEKNGVATPFLILKVSDKNTGIAGMLEWESSILGFFDTIFGTNIGSGANMKFVDIVVLGKDARSFDTSSGTKIMYSFANQNTIVIAGSQSALEALIPLATKN